MKKNFLFLLTLFFIPGYYLLNAQTNVIVRMNNETENLFQISAAGKLYFESSYLFINDGADNVVSYPVSDIKKILFDTYTEIDNYAFEDEQVMIYPNPAQNFFSVTTNQSDKLLLSLFSIDGKLMLTQTVSNHEKIDISNLKSGFYIVKINNVTSKLCKL